MSFETIQISTPIREAISKMGYEQATKVQEETIPLMLEGHNVIVESHTGSGKTAAFGVPISENIINAKSRGALVLCPTRELAVQVKEELSRINFKTRLNVAAFYGGHGMSAEIRSIRDGIDILCATPGRLLDHFRSRNLDPSQFDTVVLDEADRMLDMGFIHDLRDILNYVNPVHTHLFSATLEGSIAQIIREHIPSYKEIIIEDEIIGKNILERHIRVPQEKKVSALVELIKDARDGRVLVFVSTKHHADFLARKLLSHGFGVECMHGNKSQRSREVGLQNFKSGIKNVMVATDIAARGLQIDNVEFVVNYDLAFDAITHKHRIGRTGRMGETGQAISFVTENGNHIGTRNRFYRRRY